MGLIVRSISLCFLLGGMLYLSCNAQQLSRSCSSVKDALGISGSIFDNFIEGNELKCGLSETCCSGQLEDTLMYNRTRGQSLQLQSQILNTLNGCFAGSQFEASVAEIVNSEEKKLLDLLLQIYGDYFTPHKTIFNDFYTYLAEIPRTLDMCSLTDEVNKVLFKVYRATIVTASNNQLLVRQPEAYQQCFYNYFITTKAVTVQTFYDRFEKSFRRFWYFMRSRKVIRDVVNGLIEYTSTFTSSCQQSLLQAIDCARCSGYADIKVCHNLCMNTLRGCLVDFKEVGTAFATMYASLKSLERQMLSQFNPDHSFRSLQSGFVGFTTTVSTTHSDEIPKIIEQCGPLQQVGAPPINLGKRNVQSSISMISLVQEQMQCFDKLNNLFKNVENVMCEANGAAPGNTNCWNGKDAGSYEYAVLNTSRIEQQKNPEVSVSGRTPYGFDELQQLLEIAARDVRYLLSEEICVADDEDTICVAPNDYCNIPINPEIEIEYSGSGLPPTRPTILPPTHSTSSPVVVETDPTNPPQTRPTISTDFSTTFPPEWRTPTTDPPNTGEFEGSSSAVQYSLYMVLLLSIAAVLLL